MRRVAILRKGLTDDPSGTLDARAGGNGPGSPRLLLAAGAALGVGSVAAATLGGATAWLVYRLARARGSWGKGEPPDGLAQEVTFPSAEDATPLRGWFLPAPTRAPAIILCHGVWTGRRECLPLALQFRQAGYNVLAFDFRAHGASGGQFISVGHHEMKDVLGAVQFLRVQPEVDAASIGVLGFSMGAASAINAAAHCPGIAAVIADSAYADFMDAVRYSFSEVNGLPQYPFAPLALQWARWIVGIDPRTLRPLDNVAALAPRPLLIIHGQDDTIVPVLHALQLYRAARQPKELWVQPGAGHVGARDAVPRDYFLRVERFFSRAFAARRHTVEAHAA